MAITFWLNAQQTYYQITTEHAHKLRTLVCSSYIIEKPAISNMLSKQSETTECYQFWKSVGAAVGDCCRRNEQKTAIPKPCLL